MEDRLPALMAEHHVPGVSVALISDRQLIWSRGYGVRCADSDAADNTVQPDTIMEACSLSKPFFAYTVLQLTEQKQFDLNRPLVEYLGEDYIDGDPRHRNITAFMVLTHTTGFPNWRAGGRRSGSPLTLKSEPGKKFGYSGEGFLMLQRAAETLLEKNLDTLSREMLIEPLGLTSTRYIRNKQLASRFACGHSRDGTVKPDRRYYDQGNAAFTLYTSAEDYAKFITELLQTDRSAPHSISAKALEHSFSAHSHRDDRDTDWGLGWGLRDVDGQRRVFHSGANGSGFRCYCEFTPESGTGIVIMTNAIGGADLWKAVITP